MNLWVKKIGPILGLALFLFTCEEPGEIGLELNPNVGNFIGSYIEIPLNVGAIKSEPYYQTDADSARVLSYNNDTKTYDTTYVHYLNRVTNIAIGGIESENFGKSKINAFAQIIPLNFPADIDASATYGDINFIFNITSYFGDSLNVVSTQYFDIYELTEPMDSINFSDTQYTHSDTPIGTATIDLDVDTTFTTITTALSDDFGLKLFNELKNSSSSAGDSAQSFVNFFNGIALVPKDGSSAVYNINPTKSTRIELNYTLSGEAKTKTFVMDAAFNQYVDVDYTGTPYESLTNNIPDYTVGYFGLNSINGILGEINFEPFFALKDSLGALAINKATIYFEGNVNNNYYKLPATLDLFYDESELFDIRKLPFFRNQGEEIDFTYIISCQPSLDTLDYTISYSAGIGGILSDLLIKNENSFKLLVAPSNYGKVPTQIFLNKDKVILRIYFSHLRDEI